MIPTVVGSLGLVILTGTAAVMFVVTRSELPPETAGAFSTAKKKLPPATSAPQAGKSAVWGSANASASQSPPSAMNEPLDQCPDQHCHGEAAQNNQGNFEEPDAAARLESTEV